MIRPFTCVCFVLACGSGLYLYQAKHRVQTIDREIEKVVRATSELREQTRVLHAEWTLQSDPQRLQALSDQLLNLKTVTPGQFTSMADLDGRLPAVRGPESPPPEPLTVPIADGSQPEEPAPIPLPPPKRRHRGDSHRHHRPVLPNTSRRPVRLSPRLSQCAQTPIAARPVSVVEPRPALASGPRPRRTDAGVRFRARDGAEHLASAAAADAGQRLAMGIKRGRRLDHERRSASQFRAARHACPARRCLARGRRSAHGDGAGHATGPAEARRTGKDAGRLVYTAFGFGLLFLAVIGKLADATILQPLAPHRPERPIQALFTAPKTPETRSPGSVR